MASSSTTVEQGEFPIVCETCLGPNPYIRMLEDRKGRQCKVCDRPFRAHTWRPGGAGTRTKKTEICQTCARVKNVCQTCILDLRYGVPVAVRDLALPEGDRFATVRPQSEATREYAAAAHDRLLETGALDAVYAKEADPNSVAAKAATKAKQSEPKYERNLARVCTFYLKGKCTRGVYCPYRHVDTPPPGDDGENTARDRYYGTDDPAAERLIQRVCGVNAGQDALAVTGNAAPANKAIRTLFVGGVIPQLTERALRAYLNMPDAIQHINLIPARGIGFVDFVTRSDAEKAMAMCYGARTVANIPVNFKWGRTTLDRGRSSTRSPPSNPNPDEQPPTKRAKAASASTT